MELQPKLLRVLQEGEFERVGDELTRRVNVRMIAATNRDLQREIDKGNFRLDLYYRLGVFPIELPPLRDRMEDIPALIAHFVRLSCTRFHVTQPTVPTREVERAKLYAWPGNVRELQNVVERAVIIANGGKLRFELPSAMRASAPPSCPVPRETQNIIPESKWRDMERENIITALCQSEGKISGKGGAAELLQLNPGTLASRIKALGIAAKSSAAETSQDQ